MSLRELGNRTIPRPEGRQLFYKEGYTTDIATKLLIVYKEQRHQVAALAPHLRGASLYDTCRNIWQIVKDNIRYQMDPKGNQWVRRPAQLWWAGVGDCKSYSVFIASCLDQLGIAGTFRFASYEPVQEGKPIDPPTHVYVVVANNGREIILDAVMPAFDQEKPFTYKWDYNMTRIYELAGTQRRRSNIGYVPGTALREALRKDTNASVMGAVDPATAMAFADKVQDVMGKVKSFFKSIFGGGSAYSSEVRWLTQQYQYYVLGDGNAKSLKNANDQYSPEAQGWFATVLGVPVYDRLRLQALMGVNTDGNPLGNNDEQRAAAYLAFGPDTQGQSPQAVMQAVQIAKKLRYGTAPGSWRAYSTAAPSFSTSTPTTPTPTPGSGVVIPPTTYPGTDTPILQPGYNQPPGAETAGSGGTALAVAAGVALLLMLKK